MSAVRLSAFCKINLCLEVLGRRDDGYHDIATVFQAVSLADELTVEVPESAGIEVRVPRGGAPAGPENLCWKAAEAYRERRGWPAGAMIELEKAIPSGAGLGGGSSDAAAVLMALAQLDEQAPAPAELHAVAASLGADVPFFLMDGSALGVGRGDDLSPLPAMPQCHIVLAQPDLTISTAKAYGMLTEKDFTDGRRARLMADALGRGALLHEIAPHVYNGFSRVLLDRWPVLGELTGRLEDLGAEVAEITGSGSAAFGLFDDEGKARSASKILPREGFAVWPAEPARCGVAIIE